MKWMAPLLFAALLALVDLLRRAGQIAPAAARECLKNGAVVIDVRTQDEYAAGHLPQAIHLPLDRIESLLPKRIPDKNAVLLLHCQSGMRSAVARRKLVASGYTRVFNLGSLARASRIIGEG